MSESESPRHTEGRRRPADALLASYARTRDLRDRVKAARDACFCERHEGYELVDGLPSPKSGTPCWKSARKWDNDFCDDSGRPVPFRFDPPIGEWCATCRQRQAYTEQLRAAVRDHAAAKRAILQRGRSLARKQESSHV